jgi:hypothetical protein
LLNKDTFVLDCNKNHENIFAESLFGETIKLRRGIRNESKAKYIKRKEENVIHETYFSQTKINRLE